MSDLRCETAAPLLSDLVDESLGETDRTAVNRHLARCRRCRILLADLRQIRARAASLDRLEPPGHLWEQIAASIERERQNSPVWPGAARGTRFRAAIVAAPHRWFLAAAAVLVVTAGSALLWWGASSGAPESQVVSAPVDESNAEGAALVESIDAELKLAEQHFLNAIAGLEQIARTQDGSLDAQVAATLQKNLAVIDQAIVESRAALETQPGSRLAQESLFEALRQKVALLQDTIALVNEMRKGNQAGAARIVEGLSQS